MKSCSFGSWLRIDLRQIDGPMDRQIDLPQQDLLNSQYDLFWLNRYLGNRHEGAKISNIAKLLKTGRYARLLSRTDLTIFKT